MPLFATLPARIWTRNDPYCGLALGTAQRSAGHAPLDLTKGGLEDNEPNNFPAQFKSTLANTSTGVAKTVIASTNVPEKTAFTANFKTGAFSGTFVHPDTGATKPRGFSGVLYQKQNTGIGVFLGTSTSGPVQVDLQ